MERPKSNIKTICLILVYWVAFERYRTKNNGKSSVQKRKKRWGRYSQKFREFFRVKGKLTQKGDYLKFWSWLFLVSWFSVAGISQTFYFKVIAIFGFLTITKNTWYTCLNLATLFFGHHNFLVLLSALLILNLSALLILNLNTFHAP